MSHTQIINVRVRSGEQKITFSVENWPDNTTEALRLWGEERCNHALLGTSAVVQAQGFFRGLCTRKEKPLNVAAARNTLRTWKPSDGKRERVSKPERARRVLSEMTHEEGVAFIIESFGVNSTEAGNMFDKAAGKQKVKKSA